MISDMDPVILDSFVREVETYLPLLAQHLEQYRSDPSQTESLEEAHRLMHCIRGAGATIGLLRLSRMAQYPEDTLEQIVFGGESWNDEVFQTLALAVEQIAIYLQAMLSGDLSERPILTELVAGFRRLRGLPPDGDDAEVDSLFQEEPAVEDMACDSEPAEADWINTMQAPDEPNVTAGGDDGGVMQTLDSFQVDDDLWAAFQEEAGEHFQKLATALSTLETVDDLDSLKTVRRSVHQLKGASGVVGMRNTSKVNAAMQKVLDHILDGDWTWSRDYLPVFQLAFEVVLEAIGGQGVGTHLADRARAVQSELDRILAGERPQPAAAPEPVAEAQTQASAASTAAPVDHVDVGDDLWDAFHQEAEEILHQIGEMLRNLERQTPEPALVQALRRAVHTAKGAFGVVGMRFTSSVVHRMEDLLDALYEGRVAYSAAHSPVLFATHDLMVDALANRGLRSEFVPTATAISAQYAEFLRNAGETQQAEVVAEPSLTLEALRRSIEPAAASTESDQAQQKGTQFVRAPLERIDELVRMVSELVIHRSRFEQYLGSYVREIGDLQLSIDRLNRVSRRLQSDYEAVAMQEASRRMTFSLAGSRASTNAGGDDWDALEFDRYTEFHMLSRDLAETTGDVTNAGSRLNDLISDFDGYLNRLRVLTGDVEDRLTKLRMLPLRTLSQRFHRTVRVTAERRDKAVDLYIDGETVELDKTLLEEMAGPIDHLLRNSVDHGIENAERRIAAGKPERGSITLRAYHEGNQVVLQLKDDGRGLDPDRLRVTAVESGYVSPEDVPSLTDQELYSLIFMPGFSTAKELSEVSGRGVGLDVVKATVSRLKGTLSVSSERGQGTTFTIRLPLSLSLTRVLLVKSADETFAIPVAAISQILRVEPEQLERVGSKAVLRLAGKIVPTTYLAEVVGQPLPPIASLTRLKAIVLNIGDQRMALMVDTVVEAREAVVKSLGTLMGRVHGVTGATILGDGTVVLILNPNDMLHQKHSVQTQARMRAAAAAARVAEQTVQVLIVDDSPSVRRVLSTLVRNAGWIPHMAKDGLDALELIHSSTARPDVVLLDIEMPRMDGYELTAALRTMSQHRETPIVMLTSRAGEKHRKRAFELGATEYMIKPYQDEELLSTVRRLLAGANAKGALTQ
jgi:chemosensory pili system protein ChpA (sensor histidine kinase/response regulator)